jgi:hypothetical protein
MLSTSQREEFEQQGVLRLPGAFPRAAAEAMEARVWRWLEKKYGTRRDDPTTWTIAQPYTMQGLKREAVFDAIGSETTWSALDALLGKGAWTPPRDWGQFLVNFPSGGSWALPSRIWHTDFAYGGPIDHAHGALVLSFLSEVPAGAGGTLVVAGSPRLIRKFVGRRPQAGREKMKRTREAFLRSDPWLVALSSETPGFDRVECLMSKTTVIDGIPVRVEELCGEAGDVVIGHSWLLHASGPNCGARPRIMRVQRVRLAGGKAQAAEE